MTVPTNRLSFADIYEVFDRALADPKGIRIPFPTRQEAMHYQMRLHNARAVDRRENKRIYDEDHTMHGQSVYDVLVVRLRDGEDGSTFVYIEPKAKTVDVNAIESLSEVEASNGN